MECTKNGMPLFFGHKYAFWNRRMTCFLQENGFDVWQALVDRYKAPSTPPTDKDGNKLSKKQFEGYKCHYECSG
jgi:hypothetical protein